MNPVHLTVAAVLDFLQYLLDGGHSHSTLKVHVAVIFSCHVLVDNGTVDSHRLVSLFLRGALGPYPPGVWRVRGFLVL